MNKETLSKARKMAQKSIYDDAQYVGRWNDFEVYEPIFNDDEEHFIGLRVFDRINLSLAEFY